MRRLLFISWLLAAMPLQAASSERFEATRVVRAVIGRPDSWADMQAALATLDREVAQLPKKERDALRAFRVSLAAYQPYFAEHRFTLAPEERQALLSVIRSYEERFHAERKKLSDSWRAQPDTDHGCIGIGDRAARLAEADVDQLGPIFARHNWKPGRPNDLAAAYIGVLRAFGRFLATLTEEPNQPPEPTSGTVTDRAGARSAPVPPVAHH